MTKNACQSQKNEQKLVKSQEYYGRIKNVCKKQRFQRHKPQESEICIVERRTQKKNTKKLNLNYANNTKIYLEKGIGFGKKARMWNR